MTTISGLAKSSHIELVRRIEAEPNRRAWQVLSQWQKPFLTAFSDSDPITGGAEQYLQKFIPGAQGLEHPTIENAGHFLQEDHGAALARVVVRFLRQRSN